LSIPTLANTHILAIPKYRPGRYISLPPEVIIEPDELTEKRTSNDQFVPSMNLMIQ